MAELSLILKASVILAAGLLGAHAARRSPAAVRALVLALTFVLLLLVPIASSLVPPHAIALPVDPVPMTMALIDPEPTAAPFERVPSTTASPATSGSHWPRLSGRDLLHALWLSGVLMFLLPPAAALWRLRALRTGAMPWEEGTTLAAAIAARADVAAPIEVLLSHEIQSPLTYGARRPRIVLPIDAPDWSDADLRHALLHEMEHVRRRDWPIHLLARVACAVYWFHPLAWSAWRRLRLECERACDDAVLREAERTAYAEQLVTLARRLSHGAAPLLSMADGSHLAARVDAVLASDIARGRTGTARAVLIGGAALGLAALVTPLQAVGAAPASQSNTETLSSSNDASVAAAQSALPAPAKPPSPVAFEVVSIKRNRSTDPARGRLEPGGRFTAINAPVLLLVRQAYDVFPYQVINAPEWMRSEGYDVIAKAPDGADLSQTLGASLRTLLSLRFGFAAHRETREMPIFELVLARQDRRLGPKLQPSAVDCSAGMPATRPPSSSTDDVPCALLGFGGRRYQVRGYPLGRLAQVLAGPVGRPVVDKTGLTGTWNLELEFTPENEPANQPADLPGIFTAVEEQLGLKLQPARGTVDVLVIDRVERPTED